MEYNYPRVYRCPLAKHPHPPLSPPLADGAVYLHQGRTFLCRQLDLGSRVAVVRPADVKYYTKLQDFTDIHVTGALI